MALRLAGLGKIALAFDSFTPVVDGDFARASMPTGFSLDRPSIGTRTNSALTQVTESANVARFDYDPATGVLMGVLDEAGSTNGIRNSSALNAAAGVNPTNWNLRASTLGVTSDVVGVGVENGMPYVDVSIAGTFTGTTGTWAALTVETTNGIPYANGQTATYSMYAALAPGSASNGGARFNLRATPRDTTSSLSAQDSADISMAVRPVRQVRAFLTRTETLAAVAYLWPSLRVALINGETYSFVLRLSTPQVEVGSAMPTSAVNTSGAAATRAADTLTTTLPYPCDVLIQDRNGAEWRDAQPAGTLVIPARAGQRHVVRVRAYAAGSLSPAVKAQLAVAA